jgi:hypothetical protein
MLDNFPAGFEKFHCEAIWTWGFPIGHFLEYLVNFLLRNGFVQVVILFLGGQAGDMMDYPLYGLRSVLVGFLGYLVEVDYQSSFDLLM